MSAIRHLFNRFRHVEGHHVRDQAVLDLMELAMLIDRRSGQAERDLILHFVDTRSWPAPENAETYHQESMVRVRAALADAATQEQFLTSVVDRLPTLDDRMFALDLLERMAEAEDPVNSLESGLVDDMRSRLAP
jgi:hypothetical protein